MGKLWFDGSKYHVLLTLVSLLYCHVLRARQFLNQLLVAARTVFSRSNKKEFTVSTVSDTDELNRINKIYCSSLVQYFLGTKLCQPVFLYFSSSWIILGVFVSCLHSLMWVAIFWTRIFRFSVFRYTRYVGTWDGNAKFDFLHSRKFFKPLSRHTWPWITCEILSVVWDILVATQFVFDILEFHSTQTTRWYHTWHHRKILN